MSHSRRQQLRMQFVGGGRRGMACALVLLAGLQMARGTPTPTPTPSPSPTPIDTAGLRESYYASFGSTGVINAADLPSAPHTAGSSADISTSADISQLSTLPVLVDDSANNQLLIAPFSIFTTWRNAAKAVMDTSTSPHTAIGGTRYDYGLWDEGRLVGIFNSQITRTNQRDQFASHLTWMQGAVFMGGSVLAAAMGTSGAVTRTDDVYNPAETLWVSGLHSRAFMDAVTEGGAG